MYSFISNLCGILFETSHRIRYYKIYTMNEINNYLRRMPRYRNVMKILNLKLLLPNLFSKMKVYTLKLYMHKYDIIENQFLIKEIMLQFFFTKTLYLISRAFFSGLVPSY